MGTEAPPSIVIPVHRAPKEAPCPQRGRPGRRTRALTRTARTAASKAVAVLQVTYGEYAARCRCRSASRGTPEGVTPEAKSESKGRRLVPGRLLKDGISAERAPASSRRAVLPDPSTGFVDGGRRDRAAARDLAAHRRMALEHRIVERREELTAAERSDLTGMREYRPGLATPRRFTGRVYRRFDTPKGRRQASRRRSAIVRDPASRAVPERVKATGAFDAEKLPTLEGVLEKSGGPPGADEQPGGAGQPGLPVPGGGAVPVASPPGAGPVRGAEAGRGLEPLVVAPDHEVRGRAIE